jgi:hypothetical protein
MDAENGYGDSAKAVLANMQRIIATGEVGASIEDHFADHDIRYTGHTSLRLPIYANSQSHFWTSAQHGQRNVAAWNV